ncbi:MAG: hypothetical protein DCF20_01420 [Pseudanabaena sp.]|nr:MAG: hypothetical protein DCF20_01420 [Pseudanabaena sp.]
MEQTQNYIDPEGNQRFHRKRLRNTQDFMGKPWTVRANPQTSLSAGGNSPLRDEIICQLYKTQSQNPDLFQKIEPG